jgi:hypothetical protein
MTTAANRLSHLAGVLAVHKTIEKESGKPEAEPKGDAGH